MVLVLEAVRQSGNMFSHNVHVDQLEQLINVFYALDIFIHAILPGTVAFSLPLLKAFV